MYMPNSLYKRFGTSVNVLRWSYGLLLVVSGFDKLMELSNTEWMNFISPVLEYGLSVKLTSILLVISSIQMFAGFLLIVPRFSRVGAYLGGFLLLILSGNLFAMSIHFSRALLNFTLAVGMLVLAQLIAIKNGMRDIAV